MAYFEGSKVGLKPNFYFHSYFSIFTLRPIILNILKIKVFGMFLKPPGMSHQPLITDY